MFWHYVPQVNLLQLYFFHLLTLYLLPPSSDSVLSEEGEETHNSPLFLPFFYIFTAKVLAFSTVPIQDTYSTFSLSAVRLQHVLARTSPDICREGHVAESCQEYWV